MEKVKKMYGMLEYDEGTITKHELGSYVLHSDYARLEGLAREMAKEITETAYRFSNGRTRCKCSGSGISKSDVKHADICIVPKCEAFLASSQESK